MLPLRLHHPVQEKQVNAILDNYLFSFNYFYFLIYLFFLLISKPMFLSGMTKIQTQKNYLFELNLWLLNEDRTSIKRLKLGTGEIRNPALGRYSLLLK